MALPAPTAWPMVLALGLSLVVAGMVTNVAISLLGLLLTLRASVGWFRQVLPVERHESVAVQAQPYRSSARARSVARLPVDPMHRKMLPIETYKVTAGIKGGIAGGIAMAVPAMLFGLIKYHSIWYAINLLAAGGFVSWAGESNAFLASFICAGFWRRSRFTAPSRCWSDSSMARCSLCSPKCRSSLADSLRRSYGPDWPIAFSALSAQSWINASTGSGSRSRSAPSDWLPVSWSIWMSKCELPIPGAALCDPRGLADRS